MNKTIKRMIAGLCAAGLLFSSLPMSVFAAEDGQDNTLNQTEVVQITQMQPSVSETAVETPNEKEAEKIDESDSFGLASTAASPLQSASDQTLAAKTTDWQTPYNATAAYLLNKMNNSTAGVGSEWMIIGLIRSGYQINKSCNEYLKDLKSHLDAGRGYLSDSKRTEHSKAILALTVMGENAANFMTYNLFDGLSCLEKVVAQGMNGPSWALIALNSAADYQLPMTKEEGTQTTITNLIQYTLERQHTDGGWNLANTASAVNLSKASDVDVTAMTLQALANFYTADDAVKTACDKALTYLSGTQQDDGGFASWGTTNVESSAQVLVALTALGIDPMTDARFIKNDKNVIDAMLGFYAEGGGFKHVLTGSVNGMATEQAFYALTAYKRFKAGQTALYDMSDMPRKSDQEEAQTVEALIKALPSPEQITLNDEAKVSAAKTAYDVLSENAKKSVDPVLVEKLNAVTEKMTALQRQKEEEKKAEEEKKKKEQQQSQPSLQQTKTASGSTKSIGKIDGETKAAKAVAAVISDLIKSAQSFPENADAITVDQEKAIIDAYKQFDALEPEEKLVVGKDQAFAGFESVLEKLGKKYHHDQAAKIDFRDNAKDVLPWYVKVYGETKQLSHEQNTQIVNLFGEDAKAVKVIDISLTNVLTEKDWEPENLMTFKIEDLNLSDELNTAVLHFNKDGKVDVMEGTKEGKSLIVKTQSFSPFAVVSYHGQMSDVMNGNSEAAETPNLTPWLIGGGCLVVLLAVVIFLKIRNKSKE